MDCLDPIVVFVWFKDTSSLLQQNLLGHQEVQGKEEWRSAVSLHYYIMLTN